MNNIIETCFKQDNLEIDQTECRHKMSVPIEGRLRYCPDCDVSFLPFPYAEVPYLIAPGRAESVNHFKEVTKNVKPKQRAIMVPLMQLFFDVNLSPTGRKNWKEVFGYFNDIEAKTLQRLAHDGVCLEIGSFHGKSTIVLANVAKEVYAVDTFKAGGGGQWQEEELTTLDSFLENTKGFDNVLHYVGLSAEVVPTLPDNFFDLVFIDGMHTYEDVKQDIEVSWPKLKKGGVMAFHDYGAGFPGVGQAVHERFDKVEGPKFSLVWATKEEE